MALLGLGVACSHSFDKRPLDGAGDQLPGPRDHGTEQGAADADGASPLPCAAGFSFTPDEPQTGVMNKVRYTTSDWGWGDVGLLVSGPGTAHVGTVTVISSQKPWSWQFPLTLDAAGTWSFTFTKDGGTPVASCQRAASYTGPPPPPPPSCANRVCGDGDGVGGVCQRCPMVASEGGSCLDPPSPVTPGSNHPVWSCLDSALCGNGTCRIWCPGEPCDTSRYPDGCPQEPVDACFVDPHITDYEEACRQCCVNQQHTSGAVACWDAAINLCRHAGDCGKPYPLP